MFFISHHIPNTSVTVCKIDIFQNNHFQENPTHNKCILLHHQLHHRYLQTPSSSPIPGHSLFGLLEGAHIPSGERLRRDAQLHPELGPCRRWTLVASLCHHRDQAAPKYVHVPGQHGLEVDLPRCQVRIQLDANETTVEGVSRNEEEISGLVGPLAKG